MPKTGYVYIITNKNNTVLYTGVTSDLIKRIHQHRVKAAEGFSSKYQCSKLIYYEIADEMIEAINREKQIKKGSRAKKEKLINKINPKWNDLYKSLL